MVRILMEKGGYNILFKTMWIILSLIGLYGVCKYMPNKKIKLISNIGANTLNIYLLHSLLIKWLKLYSIDLFCYGEIINITIMIIISCIILLIFGNGIVKDRMVYLTDFNKVKEKFLKRKQII